MPILVLICAQFSVWTWRIGTSRRAARGACAYKDQQVLPSRRRALYCGLHSTSPRLDYEHVASNGRIERFFAEWNCREPHLICRFRSQLHLDFGPMPMQQERVLVKRMDSP